MINKFLYFFLTNFKKGRWYFFLFYAYFYDSRNDWSRFYFSIVGALNSAEIKNNQLLDTLVDIFAINQSQIFLYLLIIFLIFYVVKIIFLSFYNWFESNFLYTFRENYQAKYLKNILIKILTFSMVEIVLNLLEI